MMVQKLSREHQEEVVAVLSAAFYDYPVMRFIVDSTANEYEEHLKAVIGFYCEMRFLRSSPVLGISVDGSLVAAALVNLPVHEPLPLPPEQLAQLRSIIGDAAYDRLLMYEEKSSEFEPVNLHHFLGMIGVHPAHRGKGYGKDILDAVKKISESDLRSAGVCLNTEDPANVRLYEHFGYRVIAEIDIGKLHSWCMFLPVR